MNDVPTLAVALTLTVYWLCVGALVVRVRRRRRKLAGVVPEQPLELAMAVIWLPVVGAWVALPWLARGRQSGWAALPGFVEASGYPAARWLAAGVAVACLVLTIRCWRQMGRNWGMAVSSQQEAVLLTGGLFERVRHPIYSLSILLMICSLIVVPTVAMLVVAIVHIALMVVKALNEERFLLGVHGDAYRRYRAGTGRFLPRLGTRRQS